MKKQVLALSLLMAITAAGSAFAAGPKTLRIGTDPTYAPFEMKNAQGQLTGFDIDLANEICQRMETKCTFVESDFDALIPSLKAKKVDAIISSLSITAKRQQEIAFSEKLYAANSRLIAPKGSKIEPTLASLKGKTIGLLQGTTQETYANQNWRPKGVTVTPYANQDLVYQDLTAGRIDAAFQDEVAASEGFLKQPAGKDYAFAGPAVKDENIFGVGTGIGLSKDNPELKSAIDKAFDEMRKDGTYAKLAKKYFDFDVYGG
ncbi:MULTISPECIES: lysine/arginine/ornithine ABC transporter substrate-binding protein ArgT [Erwinia]|uniref:lysine/arginine/ornithine ABC transporter substrate-binding protein ArgT n=1 Tax=Erwinia pyrifoliae TaxID=79967 RepID=UPI00019610EC|nr:MULTISPECIES: lysine/arginine/ornithine ABC transporter substrate-binding protein ArgT [Erwinia]ADP13138.1 Histidine-binding periplasmic protein [Erwinia sp. Ejp617]UWS31600.1 lysine/arginine/ornithine ABC transporter substrate-binding protein ArgT [Erwinia pyrifoliae]UXK11175.1 lysine/arginine/ornithine ABC transporter substrate-binding protein ArgT [Erwinia pyrifoliae]CAX55013.1 Histidine-binding periplasmic protein [Erwinia pyrifoliae Ep1/96]CAY73694.1 Histidine ABC transport system, per